MKSKFLMATIGLLSFSTMYALSTTGKNRIINNDSMKEQIVTEERIDINIESMGLLDTLFQKKSQSQVLKETLEKGSADEQLNLGYKYETGEIDGTPNYEISMQLYLKAAAQGSDMAMNNIGWAYHRGLGIEPDQAKAKEWFEKAIEKGNLYAMANLGIAYFNGMYEPEIPQDYQKAMELLSISAEHGETKSMYAMGLMGIYGLGGIEQTEQNLQTAEQYIKLAAEQGHPLAQELLDKCQGDLSRAKELTLVENPYEKAIELFNQGKVEESFEVLFPHIKQSDAEAYYIFGLIVNNIVTHEFGIALAYNTEIDRHLIVILEDKKDNEGNPSIKGYITLPAGFIDFYTNTDERIDIAFIRKAAALGNKDALQSLKELEGNQ